MAAVSGRPPLASVRCRTIGAARSTTMNFKQLESFVHVAELGGRRHEPLGRITVGLPPSVNRQ